MSSLTPALVLIVVDDDDQVRRAVGRMLRSHGHEVVAFASAEACLAERCDADCAIVDIDLPGMSGLDLDARLRQDGRSMPSVFMTGHDEWRIPAAVERHARPILRKPLDEDALLAAIARATSAVAQ